MIRALVALLVLAVIVALRRQREVAVQLGARNDTSMSSRGWALAQRVADYQRRRPFPMDVYNSPSWSSGVTWAGGSW